MGFENFDSEFGLIVIEFYMQLSKHIGVYDSTFKIRSCGWRKIENCRKNWTTPEKIVVKGLVFLNGSIFQTFVIIYIHFGG